MAQTYAQVIRDYARSTYIDPARRRGDKTVEVVAGDVQRALKMTNRSPAVCQALSSQIFLGENNLELDRREGPPSGMSTTVRFVYRLGGGSTIQPPLSGLRSLRGQGKAVFERLGGGEAFIREGRAEFYGDGRDTQ
jgi:hypothetical protein